MYMLFIKRQECYTFQIYNTENRGINNQDNESTCHLERTKTSLNERCQKIPKLFVILCLRSMHHTRTVYKTKLFKELLQMKYHSMHKTFPTALLIRAEGFQENSTNGVGTTRYPNVKE